MTKPKSEKKKATKNTKPAKTSELPLGNSPGVAPLVITEIDVAIDFYEKKKAKRCEVSPGEISAKRDLRDLLIANRERLHTDPETGKRYYRREGVDYIIEETLKRHAVAEESSGSEPQAQEVL